MNDGIKSIKETIETFKLQRPVSQLTFLQTRVAVGGITECELIAYRRLSTSIIRVINENHKEGNTKSRDIKSFHVKSGVKNKFFKNRHIAVLMESITSDYYSDFFGESAAKAITEQDEFFLNSLLAENLPQNFGCNVIISLTGDIDADVERLSELVRLLVKRSIKELVSSQVDSIKVKQCNPWQTIQRKDEPISDNHLVINYIDNSQESLLDIDLLQQILYILGMLKKIQNKEHQERAIKKIAENKKIHDEVHKNLPKEQDVYNILPEPILGEKRKEIGLEKQIPKDIKADREAKIIQADNSGVIDESNNYPESKANTKPSLLGLIKRPLSIRMPTSKSKKAQRAAKELLVKKLSLINNKYLTIGLLENRQPNIQDIIYPDYNRKSTSSIEGVKVIESILEATLSNKDSIDSDSLNHSFIDVTSGIFSKLNWKSNKSDK